VQRARASERMKQEGRTRMHGIMIMVSKSKEKRYVDGGGANGLRSSVSRSQFIRMQLGR